jgi:hemolysin activation/secretion protein
MLQSVRVAAFAAACAMLVAGVAGAQPAAAPATGSTPSFAIFSYAVKGNTLLATEEVEAAVYPFLGENKTLADAEAARSALERRFQARGFLSVVVSLPPQELKDDEVVLEVVQAEVGRLRVTGATAFLPSRIAAGVPSLAPGQVPNFERVQEELATLQAQPDLRLTPVVTAGRTPDRIDVELKVEDKLPLHGHVEANSRQSFNTDRGRVDASVRYDNLFQRGHSASATWIVAPTDVEQSNTLVFGYSLPLGTGPDASRLSASVVDSNSSTPSSLGGSTVVRGEQLGLRWRQPLRTAEAGVARGWSLGLDLKNNRDRTRLGSGLETGGNALRYAAFSVGFDQFAAGDDAVQTGWDTSLVFGASGLNAREVDCNGRVLDQFACKRFGATPGFELLKFNVQQRRPLWRGVAALSGWTLAWRVQGQFAAHPLSSGEQIGAGGLDSVRGYYEYEQVGDSGLVGSVEVGSPAWAPWTGASLNGVAYVEGARLRVNEALPGEVADVRMRSIGFGLRLTARQGLRLNLDVALPLATTLKADSAGALQAASGQDSRNDVRVDLSLRQSF